LLFGFVEDADFPSADLAIAPVQRFSGMKRTGTERRTQKAPLVARLSALKYKAHDGDEALINTRRVSHSSVGEQEEYYP